MQIDPVVALASSLHAAPGTFGLLVGSGVSRAAGVPTGWEVTIDLVRRLATLEGVEEPADPLAWFTSTHSEDADYSTLLDALAPAPTDRRSLLEPYFEPTSEESEHGRKVPTDAHRSIARLVADGFVRVVVTTNFDRLLETALVEAGVQPVVIASPEAAAGATPLAHNRCTVIKVHGDYLVPDLKNTAGELATYEPALDSLLDLVMDQYGLIVCGWSAEWDPALRNAISRSPNRRYATYWAHRAAIGPHAEQLIAHRQAITIEISDADAFFTDVAGKVAALRDALDQQPISTAIAIAELKRYLPDPAHRIRLHDLVMGEMEALSAATAPDVLPVDVPNLTVDVYLDRLRTIEHSAARAMTVIATGSFYGDRSEHDRLWVRAIDRLASRPTELGGKVMLLDAQHYPTLLAIYAVGLGALAGGRVQPLASALASVRVPGSNGPLPVSVAAASWRVIDDQALKNSQQPKPHTPTSDRLHAVLREPLRELVVTQDRYDGLFDDLEYLLGLVCTDQYGRGPVGRFVWRRQYPERGRRDEVLDQHTETFLAEGLFSASDERLVSVKAEYDKELDAIHFF